MSGISLGVGLFSGIDTATLIQQLLAVESRPRLLAERRIGQIQLQQSALLDVNSRLKSLQDAAGVFRKDKVFDKRTATSSDEAKVVATAGPDAMPGSYQLFVDRLVSTQQMLTKGFVDRDKTGLNAGTFRFEDARARLDRDMALSELNDGEGIARGKIIINDGTNSKTIDLSKAVTVGDVVGAINDAGLNVRASVSGQGITLSATSGTFSVSSATGSTTAESLGLATTGSVSSKSSGTLYRMHAGTTLASLNDGNGVARKDQAGVTTPFDFRVTVAGQQVDVYLGEIKNAQGEVTSTAVSTVGGLIERFNTAMADADLSDVTMRVAADGKRLEIVDTGGRAIEVSDNTLTPGNTARDLGLQTSAPVVGTVTGTQVIAGLNSTLASNLKGGQNLGDGVLNITLRDGTSFSVTLDTGASVSDMMAQIQSASGLTSGGGPKLSVALNELGTGLTLSDNTASSASNLIVTGTTGSDTAAALGISTGNVGVAQSTLGSGDLDRRWINENTLLSALNQGRGIGNGSFRIIDSTGSAAEVKIDSSVTTMGELMDRINTRGLQVRARINDTGDGLVLYELGTAPGPNKMKVEEMGGSVARRLNLLGEAATAGAAGTIDGSYEIALTFAATDTLDKVLSKINDSNAGVAATVINDGSGSSPYRISLSSRSTGSAGRFVVDSGGFDLGLTTMDKGQDAVAFFGSSDPAKAVLVTSTSNTLDRALGGLTLELKQASADPVTITVAEDRASMEESVNGFIEAFNDLVGRMDGYMEFNEESRTKGPLLGDGTMLQLRQELVSLLQGKSDKVGGAFDSFLDVGIKIGEGGKAEIDMDEFRKAMDEDFESVKALFSDYTFELNGSQQLAPGVTVRDPNAGQTFTRIGMAGLFEELGKKYLDSVDGVLTRKNKGFDAQISAQRSRITAMNARLDDRRLILERQFQAMENAIAQLQSQQGALGQLQTIG